MALKMNPGSWANAFPMGRAGGLFILLLGVGVVLGALVPGRRRSLLALGAIVATVVLVATAGRLGRLPGHPTELQVGFLAGSICFEALLVRLAVARYRLAGERALLLAILFAVGLHFLPMSVAFGPLCAALGSLLCLNAGAGLWLLPERSLNKAWALDGCLKIGFGATMLQF